jgi:hypothetical protein
MSSFLYSNQSSANGQGAPMVQPTTGQSMLSNPTYTDMGTTELMRQFADTDVQTMNPNDIGNQLNSMAQQAYNMLMGMTNPSVKVGGATTVGTGHSSSSNIKNSNGNEPTSSSTPLSHSASVSATASSVSSNTPNARNRGAANKKGNVANVITSKQSTPVMPKAVTPDQDEPNENLQGEANVSSSTLSSISSVSDTSTSFKEPSRISAKNSKSDKTPTKTPTKTPKTPTKTTTKTPTKIPTKTPSKSPMSSSSSSADVNNAASDVSTSSSESSDDVSPLFTVGEPQKGGKSYVRSYKF